MGREAHDRRKFLVLAGAAGAGALLAAGAPSVAAAAEEAEGAEKKGDDEVSPVEDLMREHGVLRRVLFLYDEITRRVEKQEAFPVETLAVAAGIVRAFIEEYHEKEEEEHVFPRFEKAGLQVELVTVLRRQHQVGRHLTDAIQALATPTALAGAEGRAWLVAALRGFTRMYRPHAAREDTVLFPALRPLMGAREYEALGEVFEAREHALFGPNGFERVVAAVAQLEDTLGLGDLAQFTPG